MIDFCITFAFHAGKHIWTISIFKGIFALGLDVDVFV